MDYFVSYDVIYRDGKFFDTCVGMITVSDDGDIRDSITGLPAALLADHKYPNASELCVRILCLTPLP